MIVVLDTNVLISGLLKPAGTCGTILSAIKQGAIRVAYSAAIRQEYGQVMARNKFSIRKEEITAVLNYIESEWIYVIPASRARALPDPSDEPFLQTAIAVQADALITGNLRHFPISARPGIKVVSPREFIEQLYSS